MYDVYHGAVPRLLSRCGPGGGGGPSVPWPQLRGAGGAGGEGRELQHHRAAAPKGFGDRKGTAFAPGGRWGALPDDKGVQEAPVEGKGLP